MAVCLCLVCAIDFSSPILSLRIMKEGDTRKNVPSNRCAYSWQTHGASYNFV